MKKADNNSNNPYPVFFDHVTKIRDVGSVTFPTHYFTLLLCADFESCTVEDLSSLAKDLMETGNLYFCAWGPGCEKAHDIYDETFVLREIERGERLHVMTTWHENDSLADALWFLLYNAMVDDDQWEECSTVVITVGNEEWRDEVANSLSDIAGFIERVLEDEA